MAENSGFFASVGGDRKYNMDFLARWVASFISNGTYNDELAVTADGSGMSVTLPAGRAWINGYHYRNDGDLTLPIDNADGVLHRKDTVVLRWDVNARLITCTVIKGTPASSPIAPQIVRGAEQYDLKLAEISVPAGTTAITQQLITDTRLDNNVCGIVHAVVDHINTTTLYNQVQADLQHFRTVNEADFTAWVQSLKDVLDDETAGNLLNLITSHTSDTAVHLQAGERDKWNGKVSSSSLVTATLTAAGWTGSAAPYSQTILIAGVTATSANELLPGSGITADQLKALQAANIQDGSQAAGSITVKAYGDKPTINLPVRIIVRGDL